MAVAIYYVLRGDDHWIVRFDERDYGHNSLTSALRAAIEAARASTRHGHHVQVLVQWPDKSWVVTWTSEDDFTPDDAASEPSRVEPSEPGGAGPLQSAGGGAAEG